VAELKDYSGDFVPDIRYQDFTKDTMAALLTEAGRALVAMDGFWHSRVAERFGGEEADAWGAWVWGTMYPKHIIPRIKKVLNITGSDVYSWAKYSQVDPATPIGVYDCNWKIINRNHVIWTVNRCPSLLHMLKEGKGRERHVCGPEGTEYHGITAYAQAFNPAIKVTRLKGAPLEGPGDVPHCQWDVRLEGQ
jgi:hypothetical protein